MLTPREFKQLSAVLNAMADAHDKRHLFADAVLEVLETYVGEEEPKSQQRSMSAADQHIQEIEKARREIREKKGGNSLVGAQEIIEERMGAKAVEVADGPLANATLGVTASVPADMPVDAKIDLGGNVYQLQRDNKLHFLEPMKKVMVQQ